MAMLPGNKYLVLGTKEGQMCLYELGSNSIIQRLNAHQKEIWEISFHTNPVSLKGSLLVASASADRTIKFHTLAHDKDGQLQL
jgi:U3 small nucleolar RNA-associated protein 12